MRSRSARPISAIPSWLALLGGVAIAGLLAFVVGRPILRLKGYYLAVATLGMGLLIAMVFTNEARLDRRPERHAGAAAGAVRLARDAALSPGTGSPGVTPGARRLGRRQPDRQPDRPRACARSTTARLAAGVLGIDVARYKLIAFVLSAIYGAVAGAYYALFDGFVTPDAAGFLRSIEFVVMAVLGGLGSILGSIVGAAILIILPQVLTVFHDYEHIVLGLIMIVFMIFLPAGIVPSPAARSAPEEPHEHPRGLRHRHRLRRPDRARRRVASRSSPARSSP